MSPSSVAICAGSFDPITLGHVDIVSRSLAFADRVVVAVAHRASSPKKGMFEVADRMAMIQEVFSTEPRVDVAEFDGLLVDFARSRGATLVIRGVRGAADIDYEMQMARINRALMPELDTAFLAASPELSHVSASLVREVASLGGDVNAFVPPPVLARLAAKFPSR